MFRPSTRVREKWNYGVPVCVCLCACLLAVSATQAQCGRLLAIKAVNLCISFFTCRALALSLLMQLPLLDLIRKHFSCFSYRLQLSLSPWLSLPLSFPFYTSFFKQPVAAFCMICVSYSFANQSEQHKFQILKASKLLIYMRFLVYTCYLYICMYYIYYLVCVWLLFSTRMPRHEEKQDEDVAVAVVACHLTWKTIFLQLWSYIWLCESVFGVCARVCWWCVRVCEWVNECVFSYQKTNFRC